jgi:hypothetical protein
VVAVVVRALVHLPLAVLAVAVAVVLVKVTA